VLKQINLKIVNG
jgi:ABC-type multidrug transport system fused ATPase/permease subunit